MRDFSGNSVPVRCTHLRFSASLGFFETFGQLDDLHAQVGAFAFDLQYHESRMKGDSFNPMLLEDRTNSYVSWRSRYRDDCLDRRNRSCSAAPVPSVSVSLTSDFFTPRIGRSNFGRGASISGALFVLQTRRLLRKEKIATAATFAVRCVENCPSRFSGIS